MDNSREMNSRIALAYDRVPWNQRYPDAVAAPVVQLFAQLYGGSGQVGDVLDIACGTGALLFQTGRASNGRLVGADVSGVSCERARAALKTYGQRVQIHHAE